MALEDLVEVPEVAVELAEGGRRYRNRNFQNSKIFRMFEKDELTYKIIGCAMKVHNTLENGFRK